MTKLRITGGRGFHLSFDNGVTISVQIGGGNYSDNYDFPISQSDQDEPLPPSNRAEIAIWDGSDNWANLNGTNAGYRNEVAGYVPVDDVLDIVAIVRAIPNPATQKDIETALVSWRDKFNP